MGQAPLTITDRSHPKRTEEKSYLRAMEAPNFLQAIKEEFEEAKKDF